MNVIMILSCTLAALTAAGSGASQEQDAQLSEQVRALVSEWTGEDAPGGAISVIRDGEPILVETFGMADVERGVPITPETRFYLASLAKPITAYCAVRAARSGKLDLDASVRDLFPELPKSYSAATLRQAMHHVSGIPDVYDAAIAADLSLEVVESNGRAIELLAGLPHLNFAPGSRLVYCNSGYVLLAEAIRRTTGQSLPEYAREHVFEPFGMMDAGYHGAEGDAAISYQPGESGWTARSIESGLVGPSGLFASVEDLVRLEQGLTGKIDEDLAAELLRAPEARHPLLGAYGAGWMLQRYRGQPVVRHFGGAFGFGADMLRFPAQGVSVITLLNTDAHSATDLSESVADLVLGGVLKDAEPPRAVAMSDDEAAAFGRFWRSTEDGQIRILVPSASGFSLIALGDVKVDLVPVGKRRLEAVGVQVPFAIEVDGDSMQVFVDGTGPQVLERLPFPPDDLSSVADLAGRYENRAIGAELRLQEIDGVRLQLVQKHPILQLPPFAPIAHDLYLCERGAVIEFRRDEAGAVSGLTIDGNRAWGIDFERVE